MQHSGDIVVLPSVRAAGSSFYMAQLESGDLVDARFDVEFCAGVGGMGRVYRCRDQVTGRSVALKVMAALGSANRERFAREVRLLSALRHPGIVRYVAHGVLPDDEPFLVMEWIDGDALSGRICAEPLSVREAVSLARRLCDAVGEAHARGIVHRDLKPANIILEGGDLETPKVLDFGLARTIDTTHAITRTGGIVGTPAYMAPEQARRTEDLDTRVDVFALGCVLFECLAGYAAFRGPSVVAVLCKVLLEEPPWLCDVRSDVPAELAQLVADMLAKTPGERPADARAVREALDQIDLGEASAPSSRPSIGVEEQRYLSVILAGRSQTERVSDPPTALGTPRLLVGLRKAIAPFDAELSHLIDSSVMLTLRGHGTAGDRAARAARCALAVRDLMPHVPVVLATGRGMLRVRQPVGDVIDEAAALLAYAGDSAPSEEDGGPLLLDMVSSSLLDARFELKQRGERIELLSYRSHAVEPRKLLGRETPCVGRARELATMRAVWEECVEEPAARPIVVTGPSGIGKTRLVREWLAELASESHEPRILNVRADPMGAGGAFGMLSRLVRTAAGARDDESAESVQHKVGAMVAARLPAAERERVAGFLADMAGAAYAVSDNVALRAASHDPVLRGDQIRRAFQDWLSAETSLRPVLIVLEDLQWGDLPTVELLGSVLRTLHERPLCVLGVARPELEERFPRLWADRDVTTFSLGPLRFRAAVQLVCSALEGLEDRRAEAIAKRSGGNPFFLEELIRAEAEGRSARAPDNVLAMLQARLDELSPSLRQVLRAGSVFGDSFSTAGLAALLGEAGKDVPRNIEILLEREVIVRVDPAGSERDVELSFAQGLWRDAAYATLTERDRQLGHALAASWLAHKRPGEALAIAEHYELGHEPAPAARWFLRAARQALGGGDWAAALARATRGMSLSEEVHGELWLVQAEAHKWRGENADAARCAELALGQLPTGSAAWYTAAGEVAAACGKLGQRDRLLLIGLSLRDTPFGVEARGSSREQNSDAEPARVIALTRSVTQLVLAGSVEAADQLLALLGQGEGDASVAGWIWEARAIRAGSASDPAGRVRLAQRAAAAFATAGDLRNSCLQLTSVGFALNEIGSYVAAEVALDEAIALARQLGLENAICTAQAQLGRALLYQTRAEQAEGTLRNAITALRAHGNQRLEGVARTYLARLLQETGRLSQAEDEARRALSNLAKAAPLKASANATLASVLLALGRPEEAEQAAGEASATLEGMGSLPTGEGLVRLLRAETLLAVGKRDDAARAAQHARDHIETRAAQIADASLRAAFRSAPEHARAAALHASLVTP
jgi:tetratricopeptide (TPR) repeat protein